MPTEQHLSEEKYQQTNRKVKFAAKILLILGGAFLLIGILVLILGATGIGNTFTSGMQSAKTGTLDNAQMATGMFGGFGLFAVGGFICLIGFGMLCAGGVMMIVSHRREIQSYTAQQVMPVAKEGIKKMTPTVADAAGSIAKSVSKGIKEGAAEAKPKKK